MVLRGSFFTLFTQALCWNAFFYSVYKLFFVTLTFILYKKLPSFYFSQWALANSAIFLLLLWLNAGLKKSIPRFLPVFSTQAFFYKRFIFMLLAVKVLLLVLGLPLLYAFLHFLTPDLLFLPLIIILFLTEGICSLFLLLYHAHFLQKPFNLLQTFFLIIEMVINFSYVFLFPFTAHSLVACLFLSKIIANCGIIIFSFVKLPLVFKKMIQVSNTQTLQPDHLKPFLKHSIFMWFIEIVSSLSERNFLFPFITHIQGPVVANTFKVILDAALFFQRIPLKTIGVADTTLLSCIEVTDSSPGNMKPAFRFVLKTIVLLCLPILLVTVALFVGSHSSYFTAESYLFFFLLFCFATELILSPYARVLEVKLCYSLLMRCYAPYLIGLPLLFFFYKNHYCSLTLFISALYALRLLVSFLIMLVARIFVTTSQTSNNCL